MQNDQWWMTHDPFIKQAQDAQAFVLVFSITSKSTIQDLPDTIQRIMRAKEEEMRKYPTVIVGNKIDLDESRTVSWIEGFNLANKFGVKYMETSAKTRVNVNAVFESLVQQYVVLNGLATKSMNGKKRIIC